MTQSKKAEGSDCAHAQDGADGKQEKKREETEKRKKKKEMRRQ